jgi:hypothetical protein
MWITVLLVASSIAWGVAGFALGYRIAQRRTPVRFVQGRLPTMPLSNTVARNAGAGDGDGADRRWEAPTWADEGTGREE